VYCSVAARSCDRNTLSRAYTSPIRHCVWCLFFSAQCLRTNPDSRITLAEAKQHAFFNGLNWSSLQHMKTKPPYIPEVSLSWHTSMGMRVMVPDRTARAHMRVPMTVADL